jgi:hypothetical protein
MAGIRASNHYQNVGKKYEICTLINAVSWILKKLLIDRSGMLNCLSRRKSEHSWLFSK